MPLWFQLLNYFAEKYGWTAVDVGELTLDQLRIYLSGGNPDEHQIEWEDPELFKARLLAEGHQTPKETTNVQTRGNVRGVRRQRRRVGPNR